MTPDHICKCGRQFHTNGLAGQFWCSTCKEHVYIAIDEATYLAREAEQQRIAKRREQIVRHIFPWLKRFRAPEDRGLGDTVERLLTQIGGRPLKRLKALLDALSIDCGCTSRRDWLNQLVPYTDFDKY